MRIERNGSHIGPEPESAELCAKLAEHRARGFDTIGPLALAVLETLWLDPRTLPEHLRQPANAKWFDQVQAHAEGWDLL